MGALFRFRMPWDGAPGGATDLSGWNVPITGEADRLRAGLDGHLYRGAERVRLFGYNLSSGAPLPDPRLAPQLAARLAQLGVNYIRIAQNSNPAPNGWLDPATSAALAPEALDRLDGFIAHLARRGIYCHLVLNHFRRTYPTVVPGIEDPRSLPAGWPRDGTGITQFADALIAQNRDVARQLLSRRNHVTGRPYAEDPAIAIIEVTNEDGLARTWREGGLDAIIGGALPHLRPLRDDLQQRWNNWLRRRYGGDAGTASAWERRGPAREPQLVRNGDFRDGERGWRVEAAGGARVRVLDAGGPATGARALEVQGHDGQAAPVAIVQDQLPLHGGRPYRVSLWARAGISGAGVGLTLERADPPHRALSRRAEWAVSQDWQRYTARVVLAANAAAQVRIDVGAENAPVWLSGIRIQEEIAVGLREGERPSRGTVPPFSRAVLSLRTPAAGHDWLTFLFDTEARFFADAFRFLREDLRARALLVGTQGDCSPHAAQGRGDVTSMHAYWDHPEFPGRGWDKRDWCVHNRSLVGARDEWHPLNRLAFRRWDRKPFIVDEYNHPQPNSFGAEGFPLAAAYAGLQDWDGIAGWAYREGWSGRWLSRRDWAVPVIRNHFALNTDPVRLISAWLAAVIFRRGDAAPGRSVVAVGLSCERELAIARAVGLLDTHAVVGRGAARLPLRHRVVVGADAGTPVPNDSPPADGPVVSDTGELTWFLLAGGGVATVDTPRTKAVIGFGGGREFSLGAVTIRPGPTWQRGFGVWAITALDGTAPIEEARTLIIVALGFSQNTGQRWRRYPDQTPASGPPPEGERVTLGEAWGRAPTLAEGVPAGITLRTPRRLQVWALNERGRRTKRLRVLADQNGMGVEIGPRYRTLWYEIAASD